MSRDGSGVLALREGEENGVPWPGGQGEGSWTLPIIVPSAYPGPPQVPEVHTCLKSGDPERMMSTSSDAAQAVCACVCLCTQVKRRSHLHCPNKPHQLFQSCDVVPLRGRGREGEDGAFPSSLKSRRRGRAASRAQ